MSSAGPITEWVRQLQAGEHEAAQRLWERYFRRLVGLARQKMQGTPRRAADEEDVALSAFDSFCRGAEQGRFPQLLDRDDLWQLLVTITARKAFDLTQHARRARRDWRRERPALEAAGNDAGDAAGDAAPALAEFIGREPDPGFAAQVAEECQRLLDKLGDAELRSIALWKLEGYTNEEIAGRLRCAAVTIERRLRLIRKFWENEMPG
jgi:DNA-directed RNA polymerase specialized sigma24 family protein